MQKSRARPLSVNFGEDLMWSGFLMLAGTFMLAVLYLFSLIGMLILPSLIGFFICLAVAL